MALEKIKTRNTHFWKWSKTGKKQLESGEKVGVIFMDLPKAFDTINDCLLFAKLKAYVVAVVVFFKPYVYDKIIYETDFWETK